MMVMAMTTLSQSKCVDIIKKGLLLLKQEYPAININQDEINEHMCSVFEGLGIKVLNTINSDSMGAFLFVRNNKFILLTDKNGFAITKEINEDDAYEILILFYGCRALTIVPKLYSRIIFEKNKMLNDCIKRLTIK